MHPILPDSPPHCAPTPGKAVCTPLLPVGRLCRTSQRTEDVPHLGQTALGRRRPTPPCPHNLGRALPPLRASQDASEKWEHSQTALHRVWGRFWGEDGEGLPEHVLAQRRHSTISALKILASVVPSLLERRLNEHAPRGGLCVVYGRPPVRAPGQGLTSSPPDR